MDGGIHCSRGEEVLRRHACKSERASMHGANGFDFLFQLNREGKRTLASHRPRP
jgi:hypothetical protein